MRLGGAIIWGVEWIHVLAGLVILIIGGMSGFVAKAWLAPGQAGQGRSGDDPGYRFWFPSVLDVVRFFVEVAIAFGIFYLGIQISRQEAQPNVKHVGSVAQFPAEDRYMTIRLKNLSTRQDAEVTRIEYVITYPEFLERIDKRYEFVENMPPGLQMEDIETSDEIELAHGDWGRTGTSFYFWQDVSLNIPPGKHRSIRLRIGNPQHNVKWTPKTGQVNKV